MLSANPDANIELQRPTYHSYSFLIGSPGQASV